MSIVASPARTAGIVAGIFLAAAAFVSTNGLAATLSGQVSATFDAARATEINVEVAAGAGAYGVPSCPPLDVDAAARIPGVTAGGAYVVLTDQPVEGGLPTDRSAAAGAPVIGIDLGAARALDITLESGRLPDAGNLRRNDPVAVVPASLRSQIPSLSLGSAVRVNHRLLVVIGFSKTTARRPQARAAALVPVGVLPQIWSTGVSAEQVTCGALFATRPGAASVLSSAVGTVLDPGATTKMKVIAPPDPQTFRRSLERPVQVLAEALTGAALLIGMISIGAGSASALRDRAAEIGLRKALGARSRHVLAQLLAESAALGLIGGLLGALAGLAVTVGVSLSQGWVPVLDLRAALVAVLATTVLGTLAGFIPAIRAAKARPALALRR